MYFVVFEYTKETGGYFGNRYRVGYTNKAEFKKSASDNRTIVLAEGISEEESLKLTSLTPEVCRLTAAIEEAFYSPDAKIDYNMFNFRLNMAVFAITHDRDYIKENGVVRDYEFVRLEIGPENTEKNQLLRCALDNTVNIYGLVDLERISFQLQNKVLQIISDRLINSFRELGIEIDLDEEDED